ncbi:MAG: 1-acyl-sn-glycerol-3-phosphate acyltransferase [Candidatus Cloacimonetes bacterium]|jgi:1-acyl-sn-glycerol-3-phosphate acyltransferase|nr:1-acyl-sn-glycerol-3-phosphate acyltransferase [Candidatus Cloacimonadota bacterium]MBT4333260.1 1-acyl-sn-glycerol-3-phosphate acyltransferase [Candidatus Cloacimonadota bacterium]MBT4574970.1 1-acyl-sn-glycerol-3-phosphate acyltransferase [Candidatus Cloacimonadota bacterium]MBT5419832.1 1-acyl-sn-glycerol-3-phosphate acyltransferase [Candidatus Cloacimonadota bacterium]
MTLFYRFVTKLVRAIMIVFWNYKIINVDRMESIKSSIIAPNHISALDPPFIGSIFKKEIFVLAKYELFHNPLLGVILRNLNAIPIRRGRIDRTAIKTAQKALSDGYSLMMFPEGTRKSTNVKAGIGKIAFETQKDIVPVFIKYPSSMFKSLLRKESLNIVIGKKIKTSQFEQTKKKTDTYREIAEFSMKKIRDLENEC